MWWKIYFWFINFLVVATIISVFFSGGKHIVAYAIDILLGFFYSLSLYSFTFKKRFFSLPFWKFFFWLNILYYVLYGLYTLFPHVPLISLISILSELDEPSSVYFLPVNYLLILPLFITLYRLSVGMFYVEKTRKIKKGNKQHTVWKWILTCTTLLFLELTLFYVFGFAITIFDLNGSQTTVSAFIYIFFAVIAPLTLFIPRLQARPLLLNIAVASTSAVFFVIIFAGATYLTIQHNTMKEIAQKQLTTQQLWKAINEKRHQNGVAQLKQNAWICKVAEIEVSNNAQVGKGNYSGNYTYGRAIAKITDEYKNNKDTSIQDPFPNFLTEYTTYENTVADAVTSWDDGDNKMLYTNPKFTVGCAATQDGYEVVVTGEVIRWETDPDKSS